MIDKKQKNKASKPLDQSYWGIVKRKFRKNIPARISLILIAFIVFVGVFAPMLANDRPIMAKTTDGEVHWQPLPHLKPPGRRPSEGIAHAIKAKRVVTH